MQRVIVTCVCGLFLLGAAILVGQPSSPAPTVAAPDPVIPEKSGFVLFPYLQYATTDCIVVCWETAEQGTSTVRYGVGKPSLTAEGEKNATFHEVKLTGLKPGPYVYEVETITAAGKVVSPKSAIWMIHNAWSVAQGNSKDMMDQAKMLEEHDAMLAEIYSEHTGKSTEEIRTDMAAETWIRGSAAVEYGLADESDD
ncbi:MAG: hypothetical protein EBV06_12360, partial [Planctomycetia bacterium]|nr:hypothetical protein [Planctomycetia bacterium]